MGSERKLGARNRQERVLNDLESRRIDVRVGVGGRAEDRLGCAELEQVRQEGALGPDDHVGRQRRVGSDPDEPRPEDRPRDRGQDPAEGAAGAAARERGVASESHMNAEPAGDEHEPRRPRQAAGRLVGPQHLGAEHRSPVAAETPDHDAQRRGGEHSQGGRDGEAPARLGSRRDRCEGERDAQHPGRSNPYRDVDREERRSHGAGDDEEGTLAAVAAARQAGAEAGADRRHRERGHKTPGESRGGEHQGRRDCRRCAPRDLHRGLISARVRGGGASPSSSSRTPGPSDDRCPRTPWDRTRAR